MVKNISIKVPEYNINKKPDWENIGLKVDEKIKKYFLDEKIVIRCLSSQEHKNKSIDDLINIIKKIGHDKYNPKKKGDRYENIDGKHIDFFALGFLVKRTSVMMEKFIEPFYTWPPKFKRKPIRLDLVVIYDKSKLKSVYHRYKGREKEIKRDGFVFKYPDDKKGALLGVIKILK